MLQLLIYSLVASLFSLIGGLFVLSKPNLTNRLMTPLISFGAGAFLSAAFLHIIPEALESLIEPHSVLMGVLVGFISFFVLERTIMKFRKTEQSHHHSDHTEPLAFFTTFPG